MAISFDLSLASCKGLVKSFGELKTEDLIFDYFGTLYRLLPNVIDKPAGHVFFRET